MATSFDSAKECKEALAALQKPLQAALNQQKQPSLDELRPMFGRCFASDDPRLK